MEALGSTPALCGLKGGLVVEMMAFSIALRYVTRVTNIGLSVYGILFYLLIFWYTNKQLESHTLT